MGSGSIHVDEYAKGERMTQDIHTCHDECERPACVASRAASNAAMRMEREKVAKWMMRQGYATGHGETTEDLLAELEWQIAENWGHALSKGVQGERSRTANLVENMGIEGYGTLAIAAAIRMGMTHE